MKKVMILTVCVTTIGAGIFTGLILRADASSGGQAGGFERGRATLERRPSAGALELAAAAGLKAASLRRLTVAEGTHPAVVLGASQGDRTCAYLSRGGGAVGGCMKLDGAVVAPRISVVDGVTYVWGLAAASVTAVHARVADDTFAGSVDRGIFTIEIPNASHGAGPIDLIIDNPGAAVLHLPGVPTPLGSGG
jgi:hypothetical protein